MNKIHYIAKRIHKGKNEDKKVSQPIVRISRISIIIAMVVNIVTIAVITGFQDKVKDKVIGFGAHATIVKAGETSIYETAPIIKSDSLINRVNNIKGVKSIEPFAYKPALLQSAPDTNHYTINGIDTFQVQQEIHGVVVKGVGKNYNLDFFSSNLISGRIPNLDDSIPQNEIMISQKIANDLSLKVGKKVNIFFVKAQPVKLKYTITGIFKTGLQQLDDQIVIGDIRNVQKLNDWGVQTSLRVADTLTQDGQFVIYAATTGGNRNYRYNWGQGYTMQYGFTFNPTHDTVIRVIASDFMNYIDGLGENTAIPDTAYIKITVTGNTQAPSFAKNTNSLGEFKKDYLNDSGTKFSVDLKHEKKVTFQYIDGKGSQYHYIGGYELKVKDFNQLDPTIARVKKSLYFTNPNAPQHYRVRTIVQDHQDIFLWLSFLNLNVTIILVLMLLIATINMSSGLLVLITTKSQLIGLLKALGEKDWEIRKLFLYQASYIIIRGILIGDAIGIILCWLQQKFHLIPLNPKVYYLNAVPIELHFWPLLLLNIGTLLVCLAALLIPSYIITKISPIKALKFN